MTNARVMAIFQGASGLAEDRIVNTFHFSGSDVYDTLEFSAIQRVAAFFGNIGVAGPLLQTNIVGAYLSPWLNRPFEFRVYDLADAKPRVPRIYPDTLPGALSSDGLPEEVALCLSYNGDPPNTPRRRGRVFIGPLSKGAAITSSGNQTGPVRPAAIFVEDLCKAAQTMAAKSTAQCAWVIRSSMPSENFVGITKGYVDNAFDTQRRRGPDADARQLWTVPAL